VTVLDRTELVIETRGGEPYAYYPLGEYIVVAPGVCGGRPTFKGTRLEAQVVLDLIAADWSHERIIDEYRTDQLTSEAIAEAVRLAASALRRSAAAIAA